MLALSVSTLLSIVALTSATVLPRFGNNTVHLVDNSNTANDTEGSANVAAAGYLDPFGQIGLGCGINWHNGVSFGGGLNAGTPEYGLGGGFNVSSTDLTVGFGIGAPNNVSADTNLEITNDGAVTFTFVSTKGITCTETTIGEKKGVKCVSA